MGLKRISITADTDLHAVKLEQSPTIWRSWMFKRGYLLTDLADGRVSRDLSKCGVYFLLAPAENGKSKVYVGESEDVGMRLRQHYDRPPFPWSEVMAFVSSDDFLEKSHIRYLERSLYDLLSHAANVLLQNKTVPGGAHVKDADTLDDFVETICSFTRHFGYGGLLDQNEICSVLPHEQPTEEESGKTSQKVADVTAVTTKEAAADFGFSAKEIVDFAVRHLIAVGGVSEEELFKLTLPVDMGGCHLTDGKKFPLLALDTGNASDRLIGRHVRFSSDTVSCYGKAYFISKEFHDTIPRRLRLLEFLAEHGMSTDEARKLCMAGDRQGSRPRKSENE